MLPPALACWLPACEPPLLVGHPPVAGKLGLVPGGLLLVVAQDRMLKAAMLLPVRPMPHQLQRGTSLPRTLDMVP